VTFLESIKTCLIDKPFTFSGRASRSEFWWFFLFCFLIGYLIDVVLEILFPFENKTSINQYSIADWVNRLIPLVRTLFIMIIVSSAMCRRLHDINKSGWWQLINVDFFLITMFIFMVVPYNLPPIIEYIISFGGLLVIFSYPIRMLIWLRWMIKKGTPGPNRFGEDPLQQPQFMNTETGLVAETNHLAPAGHPSVGGEK
jgi:uncharacterized membrane protein YhaH (DUF805 family)